MALSKEVEIVLQADARSALDAVKLVQDAAQKASNKQIIKHAESIGNTAAKLVSSVLDSTNRGFRDSMLKTVNDASQKIGDKLRKALEEKDTVIQYRALREVKRQMDAFDKLATEDTQKALSIGVKDAFSAENLKEFGSYLTNTLEKSLNGVDPNDLGGLAKSLGSVVSSGLLAGARKAKAQETAAMAAGSVDAAVFADLAVAMTGAAAAITGVAAVLALFVAWAKAADDYQAKLNKSLLDGAAVADIMGMSYAQGAKQGATLTEIMNDAREAALGTAVQFKMSTEETARVLQELNSAGITYKRIIAGATTAAERQAQFTDAITQTLTYSSLLGVSVSELAGYQNTLMKDVNLTFDRTFDVFSAISEASKASNVQTKTFFTAISQATSGMALYNVRIGQAIGLVQSFSKIVGETDAAKVLGDLTGKKSADERLRIGKTAIEAVGIDKVRDLFRRTTEGGMEEFQRTFAKYGEEIKKIFTSAGRAELGEGLMSSDSEVRAKAAKELAALPDNIREEIKAKMLNIEGGAASRSFGAFALAAKGMTGGLDQIAGVMNQLDMAGKLLMMDYQATILENKGKGSLESATSRATLQQFMSVLGLDEDQLTPLLQYRQYAKAVERVRRPGEAEESDVKMLQDAGFTVEGDRVLSKDGKEIESLADVVYGLGAKMESADAAADRQTAIERQRMQGTITDALNAWVQGELFENALADQGLLGQILTYISDGAFDPNKVAAEREQKQRDFSASSERVEAAKAAREEVVKSSGGDKSTSEYDAAQRQVEAATFQQAQSAVRAGIIGDTVTSDKLGELFGQTEYGKSSSELVEYRSAEQRYLDAYNAYQAALNDAREKADKNDKINPDTYPTVVAARTKMEEAQAGLAGFAQELSGVSMQPSVDPASGQVQLKQVNDAFISKDGTMYHGPSADNILMFKDGGPLDPRAASGPTTYNVININGGDQALIYRTVTRAMQAAKA